MTVVTLAKLTIICSISPSSGGRTPASYQESLCSHGITSVSRTTPLVALAEPVVIGLVSSGGNSLAVVSCLKMSDGYEDAKVSHGFLLVISVAREKVLTNR